MTLGRELILWRKRGRGLRASALANDVIIRENEKTREMFHEIAHVRGIHYAREVIRLAHRWID